MMSVNPNRMMFMTAITSFVLVHYIGSTKINCDFEACIPRKEFCDTSPIGNGICRNCLDLHEAFNCAQDNSTPECLIISCKDEELQALYDKCELEAKNGNRTIISLTDENRDLKRTKNTMNRTIMDLNQKNADLNQRNADLNQKNADLIQKNADLTQKNADKDKEINILKNETDLLKEENSHLKQELKDDKLQLKKCSTTLYIALGISLMVIVICIIIIICMCVKKKENEQLNDCENRRTSITSTITDTNESCEKLLPTDKTVGIEMNRCKSYEELFSTEETEGIQMNKSEMRKATEPPIEHSKTLNDKENKQVNDRENQRASITSTITDTNESCEKLLPTEETVGMEMNKCKSYEELSSTEETEGIQMNKSEMRKATAPSMEHSKTLNDKETINPSSSDSNDYLAPSKSPEKATTIYNNYTFQGATEFNNTQTINSGSMRDQITGIYKNSDKNTERYKEQVPTTNETEDEAKTSRPTMEETRFPVQAAEHYDPNLSTTV